MSGKKRSISEKMAKLDELLSWFDSDDFELEAALEVFAEAKKLADDIEQDLLAVKNTITIMNTRFDQEAE